MERHVFCLNCKEESEYEIRVEKETRVVKNKNYEFAIKNAYCRKCGAKVYVPGFDDQRVADIDRQYRELEDLVSIEDIEALMDIYDIGKGPLALALGFGEVTIKRYSAGVVPSKEYSDIIRKALESPEFMREMLIKNKDKLKDTAFQKAMKVSNQLMTTMDLSRPLLATISYIFHRLEEVTPLALQKLLYFCQAHSLSVHKTSLFDEECYAWAHGPVYPKVYQMFKQFSYHVIEDDSYRIIKNYYKILTQQQIDCIDFVLETYGLFNGKILEKITHIEDPWMKTPMNALISKDFIREYYDALYVQYNLTSKIDMIKYIQSKII